jgi:hypothetical protein
MLAHRAMMGTRAVQNDSRSRSRVAVWSLDILGFVPLSLNGGAAVMETDFENGIIPSFEAVDYPHVIPDCSRRIG